VLVVDDNRDAADTLSILVKIWGHDVRVAYDGAAAFALAAAERPDVLLLDIVMPKMDGFHLARHLRRQTRFQDTLLVAVTGYADEVHRRLWEGAFDHYLIKPVEPPALEKLLLERDRPARSPVEVGGANGNGWHGEFARR
jgi:CheY-like chemotaxis protein